MVEDRIDRSFSSEVTRDSLEQETGVDMDINEARRRLDSVLGEYERQGSVLGIPADDYESSLLAAKVLVAFTDNQMKLDPGYRESLSGVEKKWVEMAYDVVSHNPDGSVRDQSDSKAA